MRLEGSWWAKTVLRDDVEFHPNQPSTKETNKLSNEIKLCQIIIKLLFTLKTPSRASLKILLEMWITSSHLRE